MVGGKSCYVCKHTQARDPGVHMHRFPLEIEKRQQWIEALSLQGRDLPKETRVSSRHFPDGDTSKLPSLSLGKRIASPKKRPAVVRLPVPPRKRHKPSKRSLSLSLSPSSSITESDATTSGQNEGSPTVPLTTELVGERSEDLQVTMTAALMARIDILEQENATLKQSLEAAAKRPFRLADVLHDNKLVGVYTGFPPMKFCWHFLNF